MLIFPGILARHKIGKQRTNKQGSTKLTKNGPAQQKQQKSGQFDGPVNFHNGPIILPIVDFTTEYSSFKEVAEAY